MSIIPVNRAPSKTHGPDHQSSNGFIHAINGAVEHEAHNHLNEQERHKNKQNVPGKNLQNVYRFVHRFTDGPDCLFHTLICMTRKCETIRSFLSRTLPEPIAKGRPLPMAARRPAWGSAAPCRDPAP